MIEWEVTDKGHDPLIIPNIHLNQMTFMHATFKLHATARFENCRFKNSVRIESVKTFYEPETDVIVKMNFINYPKMHQISLVRCSIQDLSIAFTDNVRSLLIQESQIKNGQFTIVGNFDLMDNQYLSTSNYLLINVDRSEIENSFHITKLQGKSNKSINRLIIGGSTLMGLMTIRSMTSIYIENCTIQNSHEDMILAGNQNECNNKRVLTLSVIDSRFVNLMIRIQNFTEIKVTGSMFKKANTAVFGAFGKDNCAKIKDKSKRNSNSQHFYNGITPVEISETTFSTMDFNMSEVLVARVKDCKFIEAYLKAEGFKFKDDLTKTRQEVMILKVTNRSFIDTLQVQSTDSSLDCSAKKENSLINIKQVRLEVKGSGFMMNCIVPRGFIEWQKIFESSVRDYSKIKLVDSVFNASQINPTVPLITTPYGIKKPLQMVNLTLLCAYNIGYDWIDVRSILQCKSYCEEGQYKVNISEPTVALVEKEARVVEGFESSACPLCPVGASCTKNSIKPLPDYWGFRHANGEVTMMRCPKDYRCRGRDTCKNVSSCNSGRTGPLCSQCEENTTESLFSPNCVSVQNCQTALVSTAYIFAALGYALFLTFLMT